MNDTVLLVEDEKNIISFVKPELEHEGYTIIVAEDGRAALTLFEQAVEQKTPPSIVLLDIMLPELNGLEVLRRIRKIAKTPVILLTARGETLDKVSGLDAGADDYIAKPFAIEELLARMRSVLRRSPLQNELNQADSPSHSQKANVLSFGELTLDVSRVEVTIRNQQLQLTKTEFSLLQFLMQHQGDVLSRDIIIQAVWGEEHYIDENSVDVYIRYLRSKIDDAFGVSYIQTVRGSGYTLREQLK